MTFVNFSAHVVNPIAAGPAQAAATAAASTDGEGGLSFGDLLDIVNPLQHIPVVSTLYRAISGDTIKTFPKLAGDTLYGGVQGLASSVADTIFTKLTGKSAGDTVLGWVEDVFAPETPARGVASAATATPASASATIPAPEDVGTRLLHWIDGIFSPADPASVMPPAVATPAVLRPAAPPATAPPAALQPAASDTIMVPGQDALLTALSRSGVGQDVALRAADAYRRSLRVTGSAAATALQ